MTVTLDRQRALEREQEAFLTWDHPMVRGALDLMLGSEAGNATFGVWDSSGEKIILLEAWLVVECVAPARLHVERFLPQTPLRILVDHKGADHTENAAFAKPPLAQRRSRRPDAERGGEAEFPASDVGSNARPSAPRRATRSSRRPLDPDARRDGRGNRPACAISPK